MESIRLTETEKSKLFWASFLSLAAAGFGFVFRVLVLGDWGQEFGFESAQLGQIFGASLWPVGVTMILFSLIIDRIGYKPLMFVAFALQVLSVIFTFTASGYGSLYVGSLFAGFGHGLVEAVINPICASTYPDDKSTKLNILHAAWPAGIVVGGLLVIISGGASWQIKSLFMTLPVIVYGILFINARCPVDERVEAGVSYKDMLKEFGGLGALLCSTLLCYELSRLYIIFLGSGVVSNSLFWYSLVFGVVVGIAFGTAVKSVGKPLFFVLCLIMIPLATTELGTDAWIRQLMEPLLGALGASLAIICSAGIMMVLRFFAGVLLSRFSPPTVLLISSVFSAIGLMSLSAVSGAMVFLAFIIYAVGQTYYWPTVLGFVSERFPRGGAMTLNSVSAVGLLSVGIIGSPILGVFQDNAISAGVRNDFPAVYESVQGEKSFFGVSYKVVDVEKLKASVIGGDAAPDSTDAATASAESNNTAAAKVQAAIDNSKRGALFKAAYFPISMAICFILILLYFRSVGGYKAIHLTKARTKASSHSLE